MKRFWRMFAVAIPVLLLLGNLHCDDDDPSQPASDRTAPAQVTSLDVETGSATDSSLTLTWIAPGDDANTGQAARYDLRWSTGDLDEDAEWEAATPVTGLPSPQPAGSIETITVAGLAPDMTYAFALVAEDEAGNRSPRSNVATGTTLMSTYSVIVRPDGTGDFTTVQAAIDGTGDGATIFVDAGVYEEGLIIESKSLTLVGAGPAECRIVHNTPSGGPARVLSIDACPQVTISGIHFIEQTTDCQQGIAVRRSAVAMNECILDSCGLRADSSRIDLRRCTIYGDWEAMCDEIHDGLIYLIDSEAEITETIVMLGAEGGIECVGTSVATVQCSDVWQNPDSERNYLGCDDPTGTQGNISRDPQFVDGPGGNFHLLPTSPCVTGGSFGCGRMGALNVAR